jgi:hypothetical protein
MTFRFAGFISMLLLGAALGCSLIADLDGYEERPDDTGSAGMPSAGTGGQMQMGGTCTSSSQCGATQLCCLSPEPCAGTCVTDCSKAPCEVGKVCCQAPLGCANICVGDCRAGAVCPADLVCNTTTGVCSPD